jgi:hypothetical protein
MTLKKQQLNFIETELGCYIADPSKRSSNGNYCFYKNVFTGNKCIIGKQIPEDKYTDDLEDGYSVGNIEVWKLLPESVQQLGKPFLQVCQYIHDNEVYWTAKGLSKEGELTVNNLKSSLPIK